MADAPRFSVSGDQIVDTATGTPVPPDVFNRTSTPEEKSAIGRELTARSLMTNQEGEGGSASVDEELPTSPTDAPAPVPDAGATPSQDPLEPVSGPQPVSFERPAGAPPSLNEFLEAARPANPEFDDREIAIEYRRLYPDASKFYPAPPLDPWLTEAKDANPDFDDEELKNYYTDIYGAPEVKTEHGDAVRGFIESVKQVPQLAYGLTAGAGAVGEKLFGEGGGATALKQFGVENYQRIAADLAKDTKLTDSLNYSYEQAKQGDYGALVDWLQHGFGYVGGQAIQLLATGAVGGMAGKVVLQSTAETVAKNMIAKETAALAAQSAGRLSAEELTKFAVENVAKNMGQTLAVGATALGMEGGEIFGDLTSDAARQGRQLSGAELAKAGVMTAFAGALEFAGDKIGLDLILGKSPITKMLGPAVGVGGRLARGVEAGAIAAVPEAATEFGQTIVEEWGKGHDVVGTVSPETLRQAQDAAGIGALGGALVGGTAGALGPGAGKEPPPAEMPPTPPRPQTAIETVAPILQSASTDEAISRSLASTEPAPITTEQLDKAIGVVPQTIAPPAYTDAHLAADQVAFTRLIERVAAEGTEVVSTDPATGQRVYAGSPIRVVDPRTLPATTPPEAGLSQEKLDALSVLAQAFGKRIVVFQSGVSLPNGAFWQSGDPSRIYLAQETTHEDAFTVFAHEAMHTMQGTAFYDAYKRTIYESRTPEAKNLLKLRHGDTLSDTQLLEEAAADIGSTELQKPEMWEKVFANLRAQVGDEQAKVETISFIDSLKQIVRRVKSLISTRSITRDQKSMTELYVRDLEKVQDALAEAVGKTLYDKRFGTPGQAQAVGKLTLAKRPTADRTLIPRDVGETFSTIAETQRGAPEAAMRAVQQATGGGLMSSAVERAGDLLHRMTEGARTGVSGRAAVKEKVDALLTSLTHAYGFEKEHEENLLANQADRQAVNTALQLYAQSHRTLPVYNRAQWLARATAVAVGDMRMTDAVRHLKLLKKIVDSADFSKEAFVHSRNADRSLRPYLQPIPGKLIGIQRTGSLKIPDFEMYNIDVDIPGHPQNSTVTQQTMAEEGYRIVPSELVSAKELKEAQKAEKAEKVEKAEKAEKAEPTPTLSQKPTSGNALSRLAKALKTTTSPGQTKFLLPDGTRLTWPEENANNSNHEALARKAGVWLDEVIRDGGIRYVAHFGIDVGKALTSKQAEAIIDDWYGFNGDTLQVDVKDSYGSVIAAHEFDVINEELSPTFLQEWVQHKLDGIEMPRFNPKSTAKLTHYSAQQNLTEINPSFHGTGQIGAESRRQMTEGKAYIPRSFFYRANTKIEPRFKGMTKYIVEVAESSLVDLSTLTGTPTERERAAKKQGYKGFYNSESSMPNVVAMFEPVSTGKDLGPRFSPKIWFSALGNILSEKMPAKASVEQVRNLLNSPGVKQDEVKWTGIQDYLEKQTGPVDKHNLLAWLAAHNVEIKEVVLGGAQTTGVSARQLPLRDFVEGWKFSPSTNRYTNEQFPDVRIVAVDDGDNYEVRIGDQWLAGDHMSLDREASPTNAFTSFNAATEAAYEYLVAEPNRQEGLDRFSQETRYEGYKEPGGTDYTELLLTWKTPLEPVDRAKTRARFQRLVDIEEGGRGLPPRRDLTNEEMEERDRLQEQLNQYSNPYLGETAKFQSVHFDEPDILAHVRFDMRTDTDGKNVLFLEEVQSDWHEQGREKGYVSTVTDEDRAELDRLNYKLNVERVLPTEAERLRYKQLYAKVDSSIADAPFSKTWPELVMKRMLRYAAEHNVDRLAWTTGGMQNARYGLSKHIDSLEVSLTDIPSKSYTLVARKDNYILVRKVGLNESQLSDTIGKDLAQRAIEQVKRSDFLQTTLRGLDLEMGGSGMKYFYDQMLPKFLEKYLKRFGTKVGTVQIDLSGINGIDRSKVVNVHAIDITAPMKDSVLQGQPLFAPKPKPAPTFTVDQPGTLDRVIRILQDKAIDIKRIVESVQAAGLVVPDELNPVLKEEMYMKRSEQRASDFTNDELRPLVKQMQLAKVTLDQLDQYLLARHIIADKVNAHLQSINPDLEGTEAYDRLAGMTEQEAQTVLDGANAKVMNSLAKRVDAMVEKTRDLMVSYGLEKQSTIDAWRKTYQHYVPLHREGFEEEGHPTGTGRSVRGSTVKGRTGSGLAVTNILANVAQARDQIITRGEKQRPVIAMVGLLMLHPNSEIATLDKPAQIQMTDPKTGLITTVPGNLTNYTVPTVRRYDPVDKVVKAYPDPMYKGRDNVVNFRVDGQDYAIVFNERNERAMEAAKAFKELDTPKLNGIMAAVAPYTRYLASINTQYNPIFGVVNFVRDVQFAMLALSSTPLRGMKREVLQNTRQALRGIYQDARAVRLGRHPTSQTAQMWERFQHVGGPTGYRDLFFSSTDRGAEIERMLRPNDLSLITGPQALGKRLEETWLLQTLSDYNTTMENAIRLGVFTTAVQHGVSDIQAASYAKNITVNFNKKGQIGAQMGSLFAFFNANVQGTARIFETLFERTPTGVQLSSAGKKIVAGGILVGVLQTLALALAAFGDEEPPEYIKARNLVIPTPGTGKGYVLIPMPLGFNLLPNVGRAAAEGLRAYLEGRDIEPLKRGANLIGAIYGTFSPLGGTGGPIQELLPTVADPIAAVVSNRDWTGKAISKEDMSTLDPTPGHTRTRDTASYWATFLSKGINWATGGTQYTPGVLSPTPDAIDYLIEQVTGGIGRELSKGSQVLQSAITGEEIPFYKVPLLGRFAGSASGATATRSTFYDNVKAVNLAYREFEGRAKDRTGDAHEFLRTHSEGRLREAAISIERTIGELNKVKKDLVEKGASRAEIRLRETQITGLMARFNQMVEQQRKGSAGLP